MAIRRLTLTLLALFATLAAQGQYLKIAGDARRTALYFDIDKVWNYNLYEHSRWGGGLRLTVNDRFVADGYAGYGVRDKKMKWGLTLDATRPVRGRHLYIAAAYDLEAAGSRRLQTASITDIGGLASLMSSRMSHIERVTLGWQSNLGDTAYAAKAGVAVRYSAEQRLFDSGGFLYPDSYHPTLPSFSHVEALLDLQLFRQLHLHLLVGRSDEPAPGSGEAMAYARLLAQYDKTFLFSAFQFQLFVQGGWCDGRGHAMPYTRMFDLGGTLGAPLFFRNSLRTALPNEFTANTFALLSLQLQTQKPLYRIYNDVFCIGSNPIPFVGLTAAWGTLWNQDDDEQTIWQGIPLQAPNQGILEPTLGVKGIIRWGVADWGIAIAYRMVPPGAAYRHPSPAENIAVTLTASLVK